MNRQLEASLSKLKPPTRGRELPKKPKKRSPKQSKSPKSSNHPKSQKCQNHTISKKKRKNYQNFSEINRNHKQKRQNHKKKSRKCQNHIISKKNVKITKIFWKSTEIIKKTSKSQEITRNLENVIFTQFSKKNLLKSLKITRNLQNSPKFRNHAFSKTSFNKEKSPKSSKSSKSSKSPKPSKITKIFKKSLKSPKY